MSVYTPALLLNAKLGGNVAYTLGAAARAAGVSKTAIARAIATGRLSGTKDDLGRWQVDAAELHRVYPAKGEHVGAVGPVNSPVTLEVEAMRQLLVEKDARIRDQADTITDLRHRLDTLTALLPDQRRPPWWRRWFR